MNFSRFHLCLLLACFPASGAFQPNFLEKKGVKQLDVSATMDIIANRDEIDITNVLEEVKSALEFAQDSVPRSKTIQNEVSTVMDIQKQTEEQQNGSSTSAIALKQDQWVATAIAGSAISVVVGSPLVLGASLGYAGSQLLEGEEGEKTRQMLEQVGKSVTKSLGSAIEYAKSEIEKEEDPSKIPEKMLQLVQSRANQRLEEVKLHAHDIEGLVKDAPNHIMKSVKAALQSEELKQVPGRTFNALKSFLESDEVKLASGRAMQALKESLESDEMKALQSRASRVVQESLQGKKA